MGSTKRRQAERAQDTPTLGDLLLALGAGAAFWLAVALASVSK